MRRSVAPRATFTEELDRAGIRKSELARVAGVHEQTIHAAINPSTDATRTGRVSMRTAHRIARAFAQLQGEMTQEQALTLLFTTPDELFGPISVAGLKKDEYRRITTNKLPEAFFAFLDEIFKANSAVLNALLSLLNERVFDNGPARITVPLNTCIGASNELPQGDDLRALWDRFALRLMVEYVSDATFPRLLRMAALNTPPAMLPQADLTAIQQAARLIPIPDGVIDAITQLRKELAGKGMTASDRRWRQSLDLLRAHAIVEGRGGVEEDDLAILRDALWTTPEQRNEIGRAAARLANPLIAKAVELGDQSVSIHEAVMAAQRGGQDDQAKMQAAVEGATKLKSTAGQLKRLLEQAHAQGRNPSRIEKIAAQMQELRSQVAELVL